MTARRAADNSNAIDAFIAAKAEIDVMLERLMALTGDATPPAGACNTWRALYAGIAQLSDDLINHIHLENNVLFPQFEPAPKVQQMA